MSFYSLDSLEGVVCSSAEIVESSKSSMDKIDARGAAAEASEILKVIENPKYDELRNPLIADEDSEAHLKSLNVLGTPSESSSATELRGASLTEISTVLKKSSNSIPSRIPHRLNSSKAAATKSSSTFKNDKKLTNVFPPQISEAKTKPKSYLERYREVSGVKPTKNIIHSPEGSTLSIFGDTTYEPITDVDSRPPTTTPRDDESELSFYRRIIIHPRTTRSCEIRDCCARNGELRSISEYGLTSDGVDKRISYRPYSIRDYECLSVPRGDRSLGPADTVEIRKKWEKLMRRTQYGDLASTRNRQNVLRRSELRKFKRTSFQKYSVKLSSLEVDGVAKKVGESKLDESFLNNYQDTRISDGIKKGQGKARSSQKLRSDVSLKNRNSSSNSESKRIGRKCKKSFIRSLEENIGDSSLEDLQRRHQNEKRVMDLLINPTLLR